MQDKALLNGSTKVCFVITKGNWGGAQKYVYNLATNLPKDKYDVFVVCGEGGILKEKLLKDGIRVHELLSLKRDISILDEIRSFFALFRIIIKEKPSVLHLNSPKASGLGSLAGRILFVPKIIQTIHGFTWNEDRGVMSKGLITFFTWLTMILCHKTIVISKREERQAHSLPFISKKIVLIPNGIQNTVFKEKSLARKEIIKISGKTSSDNIVWIGTIAELHKNKGYEYALEAVSKLTTPFAYFIFGTGEKKEMLENLIKKYGLEKKVFLLGFVDNAGQYLKAFDIFVLASIKEGLPYTILEAGLASLPVISTNIGGIPDIIDNGINGILVSKAKAKEITKSIEYLTSNPNKQKEFGESLQKKVLDNFSIEKMLEKTEKLYHICSYRQY